MAREHLTEGRELASELRDYLEESGKMERVRNRIAEEAAKTEAKRREREARKAERAAKKERT